MILIKKLFTFYYILCAGHEDFLSLKSVIDDRSWVVEVILHIKVGECIWS